MVFSAQIMIFARDWRIPWGQYNQPKDNSHWGWRHTNTRTSGPKNLSFAIGRFDISPSKGFLRRLYRGVGNLAKMGTHVYVCRLFCLAGRMRGAVASVVGHGRLGFGRLELRRATPPPNQQQKHLQVDKLELFARGSERRFLNSISAPRIAETAIASLCPPTHEQNEISFFPSLFSFLWYNLV